MNPTNRIVIDLDAYRSNIRYVRSILQENAQLCAVVKADGYGHGLEQTAQAAVDGGAAYLGITENREAEAIRRLGIRSPILRLRPALPDEAEEALAHGIEEVAGSMESVQQLAAVARKRQTKIPVHIKLDTGISRMGFVQPSITTFVEHSFPLDDLSIRGVMTHYPCADEEETAITEAQRRRFLETLEKLRFLLPDDVLIHTANSAAVLRHPASHFRMARAGIMTYGLQPAANVSLPGELQPVLSWNTRVVLARTVPAGTTVGYGMTYTTQREQVIATLPVGYANGYPRALSNNADVLIRGRRCPVVGRVSMNMVTVDATNAGGVQAGDEAALVGKQENERITLDELAERAGTISYELACLIGGCNRADRVYCG